MTTGPTTIVTIGFDDGTLDQYDALPVLQAHPGISGLDSSDLRTLERAAAIIERMLEEDSR